MDLKLPLIIERAGPTFIRCWLPHWPDLRAEGQSLSELRDDLTLMVMLRFEREAQAEAWRWQMAPHVRLKHVTVDTVAKDQADGRSYKLEGRVPVLLEKWPADDFWLATPTRDVRLRFPLATPEDLAAGLAHRLRVHCLDKRIDSLDDWKSQLEQRLDVLEVDATAPTILPRHQVPLRMRRKKPASKQKGEATVEPPETPDARETRRNRARLSVKTLRAISKNLSHLARDGELGRAQGRQAIVDSVLEALERRSGVGIVLVGAGGVGKTAIVHEVTRRLLEQAQTFRRDVWRVDGNQFIAGMSYVGQWEARARELCSELIDTGDLLSVDDLASLVFAGRHSKGDTHLAMFLEPHLARGELSILAECTAERFERLREEAPSFAALFDVIQVSAMTERETLPVLLGAVRALEQAEGSLPPRLGPDVMQLALELSGRFFSGRALPGRAVRLIRQVLAAPGTVEEGLRRYRAAQVYEAVRRETGLPDFVLGASTPKRREQVVAELSAQVAGQPEAIDAVTDAVLSLQASLQDPDKPLATYLFVGPTGVGKTETAKALARYLFGSSDRLVRFDMSELADRGSVERLIGAAGGSEGELLTALKTQPFCVVLFDEIEKAHPRVFDALLQFLGEGRLTDATGRTADGRNCVVVMTSNLGVKEAATQAGFARTDVLAAGQHYQSAARAFFRPELFNRIDRIVPFRSLDKQALRVVVEHELGALLRRRGLQRGNVLVDVEPELLELLVDQAFDPRFGARPLKRALERRLAVPLAHHLVRRDLEELALIEMLRRGDEPALSVTLLAPAPPIPVQVVEQWTLPRLRLAAKQSLDDVAALLGSAEARVLRQLRTQALEARTEVPASTSVLDELEALSARLESLVEGALAPEAWVEFAEGAPKQIRRPSFRTPKHNRPQVDIVNVNYAVNEDAAVQGALQPFSQAMDELEVLSAQLSGSSRGDEVVTLLADVVGTPEPSAVRRFTSTFPLTPSLVLCEREPGVWSAEPSATERRRALVFHGAAVKRLLEPWFGYGRLDVLGPDGVNRRVLVRCTPLSGGDGTEQGTRALLSAWDERQVAEREARRRGEAVAADGHPIIVLDQPAGGAPVFVSTQVPTTQPSRHLAACLKAKRSR